MSESFFPYQWTGDPWVDNSIRTLIALRSEESVIPQKRIRAPEEISLADLQLLWDRYPLDQINFLFKSYTMIFTNNGPLHQTHYQNQLDETGFPLNRRLYRDKVHGWLEQLQPDRVEGHWLCEACGQTTKAKSEEQNMDRRWFPLGGTLGSEAQAFPGGNAPQKICLSCLFALQFLPLGVRLFRSKILLAESNSWMLCQKIVTAIVEENLNRFHAGIRDVPGKEETSIKTLEFVLDHMTKLTDPDGDNITTLCLWQMSNITKKPECKRTEIPDQDLVFLAKVRHKYRNDWTLLCSSNSKKEDLLTAILQRRDFSLLYPAKQWEGVSEEFYRTYQHEILGFSLDELDIYKGVALLLHVYATDTEKKMLSKTDATTQSFSEYQTAIRRILKYATEQGFWSVALHSLFTASDLASFPLQSTRYAKEIYKRVHFYYLKHLPSATVSVPTGEKKKSKKNQSMTLSLSEVQHHLQQTHNLFSSISSTPWHRDVPGVSVLQGLSTLFSLRFQGKIIEHRNSWSRYTNGLCPLSTLRTLFHWPEPSNPLLAEHWYTWLWHRDQGKLYPWLFLELFTILMHQLNSSMTVEQAHIYLASWCPGDSFAGEEIIREEKLYPIQQFCQIFWDRFVFRRGSLRSFEREQLRELRIKPQSLRFFMDIWFPILQSFAQEQFLDLPEKEEITDFSEDPSDLAKRMEFFVLSMCALYRERRRHELLAVTQEGDDSTEETEQDIYNELEDNDSTEETEQDVYNELKDSDVDFDESDD